MTSVLVAAFIALTCPSGLDNAGKTTIVKKFNGDDIDSISPTLGFNIYTLEFQGCVDCGGASQGTVGRQKKGETQRIERTQEREAESRDG